METNPNKIIGEMGFDSSLHNSLDAQLTPQEYQDYLRSILQPILDHRFPGTPAKRKSIVKHGRINFACPYCGDSAKSDYAKRGNFIMGGKYKGYFKCQNCGEFKKITTFFKDYKTELKLEAVNYAVENLGDFTTFEGAKYDMSMFFDMEHLDKYAIDRQEFLRYFGLVEVKDSPVWSWLTKRLQYQEDKFLYNPVKNYILILNLTQTGKILGAQKRLFKGANRFETYKMSKLYTLMNKELEASEEQIDYLDTVSMVFNICLINFSKTISLFEGPMDAFLFKNSIANTGANKELPIEIPVRYFYDSDETGKRKSFEHIEKSEEVFLWDKFLREHNFPFRMKWDFNDVLIYARNNGIKLHLIDNYFSGEPLDAIDI
jgi:hypothetical protein